LPVFLHACLLFPRMLCGSYPRLVSWAFFPSSRFLLIGWTKKELSDDFSLRSVWYADECLSDSRNLLAVNSSQQVEVDLSRTNQGQQRCEPREPINSKVLVLTNKALRYEQMVATSEAVGIIGDGRENDFPNFFSLPG